LPGQLITGAFDLNLAQAIDGASIRSKVLYNMRTARVPIAEARKNLAALLKRAEKGDRIKLTRYDKTLGGLVPKTDLDSLEECDDLRAQTRKQRPK
jgi:prevent-host-death family protein